MTIEEINILQDIVDIYEKEDIYPTLNDKQVRTIKKAIKVLGAESLTDTEQRIFLAAMGREEKICKEDAYINDLVAVCHSIKRKVKATLWE